MKRRLRRELRLLHAYAIASLLALARTVGGDLKSWRPRDLIDIQSFLWVQGSDEYD